MSTYVSPRTLALKAAAAKAAMSSTSPSTSPSRPPERAPLSAPPTRPTRRLELVAPPASRGAHNSDQPSAQARVVTQLSADVRAELIAHLPALTRRNAQVLLYDRASCMRCGHHFIPAGTVFEVAAESGGVRCEACDADALIPLSYLRDALSALMREPVTPSLDLLDGLLIEGAARHLRQSLAERRALIAAYEARLAAHLPRSSRRLEVWRESAGAVEPPRSEAQPTRPARPARPSRPSRPSSH